MSVFLGISQKDDGLIRKIVNNDGLGRLLLASYFCKLLY